MEGPLIVQSYVKVVKVLNNNSLIAMSPLQDFVYLLFSRLQLTLIVRVALLKTHLFLMSPRASLCLHCTLPHGEGSAAPSLLVHHSPQATNLKSALLYNTSLHSRFQLLTSILFNKSGVLDLECIHL